MSVPPKPDPEKYCTICGARLARKRFGKRLEDLTRFISRQTCSQSCGNTKTVVDVDTHRWRARRYRAGRCAECSGTERLHVHHIDRNPANNDPSNLTTLCQSCHLKLHWREDRPARMAAARRAAVTAKSRGTNTRPRSVDGKFALAGQHRTQRSQAETAAGALTRG